jgi:hypothetical protein
MNLTTRERAIRRRLRDDLEYYAEKCLKIRTKEGKVAPLRFNRAQRYIHSRLEEQRTRTGRVRALILKGRQQGCSTYVGARFYHRTTHGRGLRTFILTHEDAATANLFEMVNRYHEHCPALVKPSTGAANAKELNFDRLDSGLQDRDGWDQGRWTISVRCNCSTAQRLRSGLMPKPMLPASFRLSRTCPAPRIS